MKLGDVTVKNAKKKTSKSPFFACLVVSHKKQVHLRLRSFTKEVGGNKVETENCEKALRHNMIIFSVMVTMIVGMPVMKIQRMDARSLPVNLVNLSEYSHVTYSRYWLHF